MGKSPAQMAQAIIANLPKNTGKTLTEWITILRAAGPADQKAQHAWLREQYGFGPFQAWVVVWKANEPADYREPTPEQLLDAQYVGAKAALRPIYERLWRAAVELGPDVEIEPRKTYVSVSRRRQIATLKPAARGRFEIGLALRGVEPAGVLQAGRLPAAERISHQIDVTSPDNVTDEVIGWLRLAYERDA